MGKHDSSIVLFITMEVREAPADFESLCSKLHEEGSEGDSL